MTEIKKKAMPQFRGKLFRVDEFSSGALLHMCDTVEESLHTRPTSMLVSTKLDLKTIHLPDKYKDIDVQPKQYVHAPNVVMIGVWS